jgi:hypothetical protein
MVTTTVRSIPHVVITNLNVKIGTDFRMDFRCKDENDEVVDLTGYTAAFRAVFRDTVITKSTSDLLDQTTDGDAAIGMIHLHLTEAETRLLTVGKQTVWSIVVREPGDNPPGDGDEIPVVEGYINARQGADNVD